MDRDDGRLFVIALQMVLSFTNGVMALQMVLSFRNGVMALQIVLWFSVFWRFQLICREI